MAARFTNKAAEERTDVEGENAGEQQHVAEQHMSSGPKYEYNQTTRHRRRNSRYARTRRKAPTPCRRLQRPGESDTLPLRFLVTKVTAA